MRIKKAVITAAGMGTRLLPYTKETPKEMMPIYSKSKAGKMVLKPILQVIYESIFDFGIRDFCFVVGRGKRSIEDHFLISKQNDIKNDDHELEDFFKKIIKSNLIYVQQPNPKGFGDAILKSKFFVENNNFLLHAGDDIIISYKNSHLKRLETAFNKYDADMAFFVTKMKRPTAYGVIEGKGLGKGIIQVKNLEEKPKKPKSNMAVIATYIFRPTIFNALEKSRIDKKYELQLAIAIQKIIKKGNSIAVELKDNECRIDVGSPESYVDSLNISYKIFQK